MIKWTKTYKRADDPELLAEAKYAKVAGYRHHARKRNGLIISTIAAPHARSLDEVKTRVAALRHLGLDQP